jgi:hypothetical protein
MSPEEPTFHGKTLEAALAWCLVLLMAPELDVGGVDGIAVNAMPQVGMAPERGIAPSVDRRWPEPV